MKLVNIIAMILMLIFTTYTFGMKKIIFNKFADAESIGNIREMLFDGNDYWFVEAWGSLIKYNPLTKKFITYNYGEKNRNSFKIEGVLCLEKVNEEIWFGLQTKGIATYDKKKNELSILQNTFIGNELTKVTSIYYDENNQRVWIGTIGNGLYFYDLKNDSIQKLNALEIPNIYSVKGNDENLFIVDKERLLMVNKDNYGITTLFEQTNVNRIKDVTISKDCIYFVLQHSKKSQVINYTFKNKETQVIYERKYTISINKYNQYLIISTNTGIDLYNTENGKISNYNKKNGLISNSVNRTYIERDNIWVLTQGGVSLGKTKVVID